MDFISLLNKMQNAEEKKLEPEKKSLILNDFFKQALSAYFSAYYDAACYATRICDGEIVDENIVINIFKSLPVTYASYIAARSEIDPAGKPISLVEYGIPVSDINICVEGNRLVGEGILNGDLSMYEHGMWLLHCCRG